MSKVQTSTPIHTKDTNSSNSSTEIALPQDLLARIAAIKTTQQRAVVDSAKDPLATRLVSTAGSRFTYKNRGLDEISAVILDGPLARKYFELPFDSKKPAPPTCQAYSEDGRDHGPAALALHPQSTKCATCQFNQWGSGPNNSKKCRETRFIILLPDDALESPETIAAAEVAYLQPGPTKIVDFTKYVGNLANTFQMASFMCITRLNIEEGFHITYQRDSYVKDPAILSALMDKRDAELAFLREHFSTKANAPAAALPTPQQEIKF